MPDGLRALPADGAALLVETRAATAAALAVKVDAIVGELASFALAAPLRFATDAGQHSASEGPFFDLHNGATIAFRGPWWHCSRQRNPSAAAL